MSPISSTTPRWRMRPASDGRQIAAGSHAFRRIPRAARARGKVVHFLYCYELSVLMRVIAGDYKGQRLVAPKGAARPTLDRVREALFSMLGPIEGLRVLDLYAGSGALGIEALSRGAAEATFVDSDQSAVRAVRQNLSRLGIDPAHVTRSGVGPFLRHAARKGERWDLAFCDPPYRLAHRLGRDLGELLPPVLVPEARVVCESSVRHPLELQLPLLKQRRYADTVIAIYTPPEESERTDAG